MEEYMIIQCEKCQKKYRIDDSKISQEGLKVRCSNCKNIFWVKKTEAVSGDKKNSGYQNDQMISENNKLENNETSQSQLVKTDIENLPDFAEWDNDIIIVTLPGETLDAANCQDFKDAVHLILETSNKVIFNMERIQFVDSSGCGTLNSCIRKIKNNGGDIKICNVLDQVGAIFRLIKLNRVFHICDTREDAISSYASTSV